jgi:DNA repair photolyase
MAKSPHMKGIAARHEDVVVRRSRAIEVMRSQLVDRYGRAKFNDPKDVRVIYASPLVDIAANMELVRETIEACKLVLDLTHWKIRLLSKSNLLPVIAKEFSDVDSKARILYGVSTGTLDDKLARSFEQGTPLPSKRIESLRWLQDNGYQTYGMVCPSLPQRDYDYFAYNMSQAIRSDQCEHVWAEVVNVRGESLVRTVAALRAGGFAWYADELEATKEQSVWEQYSRATFLAHASIYGRSGKLRFLQYVAAGTRPWWDVRRKEGAILL